MATTITDWTTYAAALALTLTRMPADGCLIIGASGNRFAQFTLMADVVHAEIVDDAVLAEEYRLSWDDKARLVADGWAPPTENSWPNWHRDVAWPARYRAFEDLSRQAVTALHEILKVTAPSELVVQSWVNFTDGDFDVSALT
ncbi:hypothetical protein AB0H76_31585 [Nocardia sp. NPDC050712]|uniref:TY-Chap domain-containing protein n=1 Tax=Nocardia sp. NPDC050712 TaxID=3155518 RepID=UPI0033C26C1D